MIVVHIAVSLHKVTVLNARCEPEYMYSYMLGRDRGERVTLYSLPYYWR